MKTLYLTALIRRENPVYVSWCPELNVSSQGKTIDSALKNLQEAVNLYIEDEDAYVPEELFEAPSVTPAYICFQAKI